MFKIFGTPNTVLIDMYSKYAPVQFDKNGEVIVKNNPFTQRIIKKYKYEEITEAPKGGKSYQCKKCDFTTGNKGELMTHYRTEHPKE